MESKKQRLICLANTSRERVIHILGSKEQQADYAEKYSFALWTPATSLPKGSEITNPIVIVDGDSRINLFILNFPEYEGIIIGIGSPYALYPNRKVGVTFLDIKKRVSSLKFEYKKVSTRRLIRTVDNLREVGVTATKLVKYDTLIADLHAKSQGQFAGDFLTLLMKVSNAKDRIHIKETTQHHLLTMPSHRKFSMDDYIQELGVDSLKEKSQLALVPFLEFMQSKRGKKHIKAFALANLIYYKKVGKLRRGGKYHRRATGLTVAYISERYNIKPFDINYLQKQRVIEEDGSNS